MRNIRKTLFCLIIYVQGPKLSSTFDFLLKKIIFYLDRKMIEVIGQGLNLWNTSVCYILNYMMNNVINNEMYNVLSKDSIFKKSLFKFSIELRKITAILNRQISLFDVDTQ